MAGDRVSEETKAGQSCWGERRRETCPGNAQLRDPPEGNNKRTLAGE